MKLKELKGVLWSPIGSLQSTVVWNANTYQTEVDGCSIEYAVKNFGEWEVVRIGAFVSKLVLSLEEGV